uniref:Uncharacterized protein n=1 Tax=Arcella intermedia TaxID=1963864 RepID=A0A6B2LRQ8_9EUKA
MHVAAESGYFEVVKLLIQSGADINALDNIGYSALHYSVQNRHRNVSFGLIDLGANIEHPQGALSVLHIASARGDLLLVDKLLKMGAQCCADARCAHSTTRLPFTMQHDLALGGCWRNF